MLGVALLVVGLSIYSGETASADLELRGQILGSYITQQGNYSLGFSLRRARLILKGFFLSKSINYYEQLTLEGSSVSVRDLYLNLIPYDMIEVRLGQFKVPYNREELTSSSRLELVDRSIANEYFFLGRDIGLDISLGPKNYKLHLGAFTGAGRNISRLDPSSIVSKGLLYTARLELSPVGKFIYDQPNLKGERAINIGASFVLFPISDAEATKIVQRADKSEFMKNYVIQEKNVREGTLIQGEADLKLWWNFVGVEAEGLFGRFKDNDAVGFRVQPSVIFGNLGFAVRYALISPKNEKEQWEITAGPSYYFKRHNLKLQADYSYVSGFNIATQSRFNKSLIRLQLQFVID